MRIDIFVLLQLLSRSVLCSSYLVFTSRSPAIRQLGIPSSNGRSLNFKGYYLNAGIGGKPLDVLYSSVNSLSNQLDLALPDFHVITRVDAKEEIKHVDLYLRFGRGGLWWAFLIRSLPQFLRPKPSAKTGVRTYVSSSGIMDQLVTNCFGEKCLSKEGNNAAAREPNITNKGVSSGGRSSRNIKSVSPISTGSANAKWAAKSDSVGVAVVGLFVYMWITPSLRRRNLGDILLEKGKGLCAEFGANFMILVHDDNGTGKLIDYYSNRGFRPIFDVIDKGMLGMLS